jgi:hypothetical protein
MSSYTFLKSVGEEGNPGRSLLFLAEDIPLCLANEIPKSALTYFGVLIEIYIAVVIKAPCFSYWLMI